MDAETISCYDAQAVRFAEQYRAANGGVSLWFGEAFPGSSRILDVGCGSGGDLCRLIALGHDAVGVDASRGMLAEAAKTCRQQGFDPQGRLVHDSLPDLASFGDDAFDAVLCVAVLMHVPEERLFDSIYGIRRVLRPGGRLLLSLPKDRPDVDPVTRRDPRGRYFAGLPPAKAKLLLERVGFRLLWERDSDDALQRPGHAWVTFLLERSSDDGERPLDQVESILNRDKKDATYKLALFRALADIAQTQYNIASYEPHGRVGIPIEALAERWMIYYWPIVASPTFIPQKYGEVPGCAKPVAIRSALRAVIDAFGEGGGLSAFMVALKNGELPSPARKAYQDAMRKIGNTIWNMPVRYAGGRGDFSVFDYDRRTRRVTMPEAMWRELTLTGSWIMDATVLRWAELSERLSKGAVPVSLIVEKLLSISDPKRETSDAQQLFIKINVVECVWTGRSIQAGRFDVDHVIPFVLWRNNDLWNLLPAHPVANNAKRDLLPAQPLLRRRRQQVIGCWEALRSAYPERFDREAAALCGTGRLRQGDWQMALFSRMAEAVEITAIQRCVPRWDPEMEAVGHVRRDKRVQRRPVLAAPGGTAGKEGQASVRVGRLPLVGLLAAGFFSDGFLTGNLDETSECDWVDVPISLCKAGRFVVRVAGDSMTPLFQIGDLLVFEYHRTPRHDGQIVIAADYVDGATTGIYAIKRYQASPDAWIFASENPVYGSVRILKREMQYPILGTYVDKLETVEACRGTFSHSTIRHRSRADC